MKWTFLNRFQPRTSIVDKANTDKVANTPRIYSQIFSSRSSAGPAVSSDSAMSIDSVLACVRVLAESIASLPLEVKIKDDKGGSTKAKGHPLYRILKSRPNPEMTSYEFRFGMTVDALLRGAGYAQIARDGDGTPVELWPLEANLIRSSRNKVTDELEWTYGEYVIPDSEILRFQLLPWGSLIGKSIVDFSQNALGTARAANESAAEFFANGMQPSVVIETPVTLTDEAANMLRQSWEASNIGAGRRHRPLLLENGMKATPLQVSAEEAQLLETRKYTRSQIAGIFRVPPHMIGDLERATFSNIEQQGIDFITNTLRPLLENIEQRYEFSLLSEADIEAGLFIEHNVDAFLRGDRVSRMNANAQAINCGIMSINEARAIEGLPAIPDGDAHLVQGAMISLQKALTQEPTLNAA